MRGGLARENARVKGAVSGARAGAACILLFFGTILWFDRPAHLWLTILPAVLSSIAFIRSLVLEVRVSSHEIFVRSWLRTYRFAVGDITYVGVGNYEGAWVRGSSSFGLWSVYVEVQGRRGRERVDLYVTVSGRRRAERTVDELRTKLSLGGP